jgi:2,4-dienoyl-CoA reductase-like NADH-dependent reductase (Old Yellow Enzyme family)/thioredoxin reductase
MALTHILTPIRINRVELPNRVVRTAHATNLGAGVMGDDLIAYYAARAKGGVGLSIIETLAVHPTAPLTINVFLPNIEDGYRKLVDRVAPTGMKLFQQLWHGGHNAVPVDGGPPWSASDIPSTMYGQVPIPMTKAMIDTIVEAYADAARRCESWGLDGVEVHAAHGYLPAQFLSPNFNKREDEYGGSFENRVRFLHEVVSAVRSAVSDGFPVGIRVAPDDLAGGVGVEDNLLAAQYLEARGLIDYVNISMGNYQTFSKMIGGMHEPAGYELPTSVPISRSVKLPAIVTGRFRTLEEGDQIIRAGDAAMVSFVRALIADPDMVAKTRAGHPEQVRPCIACNQGCAAGVLEPPFRMGCAVNPGVGFESSIGDDRLVPAETSRRILVVGGGPAGMEAARVARLRGHRVTLAEAGRALGGAVLAAAKAPTRHGIRDYTVWQEQEIFRLGVEVRLSTYLGAEDIAPGDWDAVIVATGSSPRLDGIQISNPGEPIRGLDDPRVLSSGDLLLGPPRQPGRTAVVIDDVGHYEGLAAAEYLQAQGVAVAYVTRHISLAPRVETALMVEPALQRMKDGHFSVHLRSRALSIGPEGVVVCPIYLPSTTNTTQTLPADTIVLVTHNRPNRELFDALGGRGIDVSVVGDANSPRLLQTAIREGHLAGARI